MTLDIALVLGILVAAFVLFVTERLRMDLVALLVMSALALTGLVSPADALSGFSNPAVITVWGMFILSAGLTNAGVTEILGRRLLGWSGTNETLTVATMMLTAGVLSAFMNNIGVAAMMLPVAMSIARRTGFSPSRLLMPLAFGSLLGGLTTLIGTPPNLLVSNALRAAGHEPFGMFDFSPIGGLVLIAGTSFVVLAAPRLLPRRDPALETSPRSEQDLRRSYEVDQYSAVLRVPEDSELVGRSLRESRLGRAAGLTVYAILRDGQVDVAPEPGRILRGRDRLLAHGRLERFQELRAWRDLEVQRRDLGLLEVVPNEFVVCEVVVPEGSALDGTTIAEADLRKRHGVVVVAIRRDEEVRHAGLAGTRLAVSDRLLLFATPAAVESFRQEYGLPLEASDPERLGERYRMEGRLYSVRVPEDSVLVGSNVLVSRLGDALGAGVLALVRGEEIRRTPTAEDDLRAGDQLIVRGDPDDLRSFRGLQRLVVESEKSGAPQEAQGLQLMEVMLSPRSSIAGWSLRDLRFRERYGLAVLSLLRGGEVIHTGLARTEIGLGDALLCVGTHEKAEMLRRDPDFLILDVEMQPTYRQPKAPLAALVMAAVVATVLLGHLPISIAAVAGAALMVLTGCLSMDQAYRAIEWRSVFLIAGMLPLGIAMEQSGAAAFLARGIVTALGPLGVWGVVAGLYLMTAVLTCVVPTAALVVLVAPIVLDTAARLGLSEHSLMMAVAMAASASFTSPISHPANVLVMGPGGYRFVDYVKLGVPLTLVVMVVVLVALPVLWPLDG